MWRPQLISFVRLKASLTFATIFDVFTALKFAVCNKLQSLNLKLNPSALAYFTWPVFRKSARNAKTYSDL